MDQFSHDLTLALEETSLMDRASGVGRWGSRRRTRSTGNLPCAPQPTEDSSSSPTDTLNVHGGHTHAHAQAHAHGHSQGLANMDSLDTEHIHSTLLPASDSDDKADAMLLPVRLSAATAAVRMGVNALESDSLNETTFSPARFYKPNSRRKRKIKRMSMEFEFSNKDNNFTNESPLHPSMLAACLGTTTTTGTLRKRLLKSTTTTATASATTTTTNSNFFFCGKRKRSNRDRYYHEHEHDHLIGGIACVGNKLHSSSVPRYAHMEDYQRMRPRSYSSTSKPHSERLLPLNKGLLSKINRMAQQQQHQQQTQKTDNTTTTETTTNMDDEEDEPQKQHKQANVVDFDGMKTLVPVNNIEKLLKTTNIEKLQSIQTNLTQSHSQPTNATLCLERKSKPSSSSSSHRRRRYCKTPQPQLQLQLQLLQQIQSKMDCSELCDFLSSSSLSSSSSSSDDDDSDNGLRRHDTDREGDDELTDWPGNEMGGPMGGKYDPKRKLTKKSLLPQIRSDDTIGEDDTLMSGPEMTATTAAIAAATTTATTTTTMDGLISTKTQSTEMLQDLLRFQPAASSKPIEICGNHHQRHDAEHVNMESSSSSSMLQAHPHPPPNKQIESEMSGETSNPFLSSSSPPPLPPNFQVHEVREIRAGCRRINGDRPGFSIKLNANERLSRFLQDPRQTQIRLTDIELGEQDSLLSLATLYSLNMVVEHGCTVLTKTRNTTQTVNTDPQRNLQQVRQDHIFGDLKRRCYGDDDSLASTTTTAAASSTTATEPQLAKN